MLDQPCANNNDYESDPCELGLCELGLFPKHQACDIRRNCRFQSSLRKTHTQEIIFTPVTKVLNQRSEEVLDHSMSLWAFIEQLTREKRWGTIAALFGLATFSLTSVVGAGAFIANHFWAGGIEIVPSAGSIKLLQENRQYKMQLVHPYGWQTTDIEFESGQTGIISAGGMVTVGYLEQFWDNFAHRAGERCIEVRGQFARPMAECTVERSDAKPLAKAKWPWVGPAGYSPEMYEDPRYQSSPFKGERAQRAMVEGTPHGTLVGVIRPKGQTLSTDETVPKNEVYELGKTSTITAKTAGVLWVGVNDSGSYFHDNLGFFSLTVSTQATRK